MFTRGSFAAVVFAGLALAGRPGLAAEHSIYMKPTTDPFFGAFQSGVRIEVPAFHGIEPRLAFGYRSPGGNGFVGVGWSLDGLSVIERAGPGRGTPRYDGGDIFLLDGDELVACTTGMVSPSCTTGGTHATKRETYRRIIYDAAHATWTVWERNGTKTTFSPVFYVGSWVFRWGQTAVADPSGNQVSSSWVCDGGDCYPTTVRYGGYQVDFFRESRPDILAFSTGRTVAQTRHRLRSVIVWRPGTGHIRGYKLSYETSPDSGRSRLASVQQYGRDLVQDGAGLITAGTTLPAITLGYRNDPAAGRMVPTGSPMPPPATGTENASWVRSCARIEGAGNSLRKTIDSALWDCGASSSRAISAGDGGMEFTVSEQDTYRAVGLSHGDDDHSMADIDFAMYLSATNQVFIYEKGVYRTTLSNYATGDRLRIEVQGGVVRYKRNGVTLYTSTQTPTYPLRIDASIYTYWASIEDVRIFGNLESVEHWCRDRQNIVGDFNGDGRSDLFCHESGAGKVSLGTASGFAPPTIWTTSSCSVTGDFDGDGKTDLLCYSSWGGTFMVMLSTGSSFTPAAVWNDGICRASPDPTNVQVADVNGDGRDDVFCRHYADGANYVGLSTGRGFSMSNFGWMGCGEPWEEQIEFADVNGDGKSDQVCTNNGYVSVFPSTGDSFNGSGFGAECNEMHALGDINGDGKADVYCATGKVFLANGWNFTEQAPSGSFCWGPSEPAVIDLDGDGLGEVVCLTGPDLKARRWDGTKLGDAKAWAPGWCPSKPRFGDFNGDGKVDALCPWLASPLAVSGTANVMSDSMISYANGLGAITTVEYTPSSNWTNTNAPPVVQTVTALTEGDGRGGNAVTRYSYGGGLFNRQERRFLGFRSATVTEPCLSAESSCPVKELRFKQDYGSLSKLEYESYSRGDGVVLAIRYWDYVTNGATVPYTSLLQSERIVTTDASGVICTTWPCARAKRVQVVHGYDAFGNEISTQYLGDMDENGDERTLTRVYRPNPSAYIVDRTVSESTFAGGTTDGELLAQQVNHYDGATVWDRPPTRGLPTEVFRRVTGTGSYVSRRFSYDAQGNVVEDSDETGRATAFAYDSLGLFLTAETNAAAERRTTAWDVLCGKPLQVVDENGQATTTTYDPLCRIARVDAPLGAFTIRSYVDLGNPATQHERIEMPSAVPNDPTGHHWTRRYFDGFGRTYRSVAKGPTAEDAATVESAFDARGNLASVTAPYREGRAEPAQRTTYQYDALDRRVRSEYPDGTNQRTTHGVLSETSFDEEGFVETRLFDVMGRVIMAERPLGNTMVRTTMAYDLLGNVVSARDTVGNRWAWQYDALGRMVQRTNPDAGTWRYEYDAAGRDTATVDAKGQRTELTYDVAGRLGRKISGAGTPAAATTTVTYGEARPGFFNIGRETTIADSVSTLRLDHDALDRAVKQVRTLEGSDYVFEARFDAGGRITRLTYPDGDSFGDSVFDAAGRLRAIAGIISDVQYDAAGRVTRVTSANGTVTTRSYTPARGRLGRIQTVKGGTNILDLAYSHNPRGLITEVKSPNANESFTYDYDGLRRLVGAHQPGTPSQTFAYDSIGNVISNSRVGELVYAAPGSPRPHAPVEVKRRGGMSYLLSYDANGNLLYDGRRTFAWTPDNRAATIESATFTYDGFGDRLKKAAPGSSSLYPLGDDYEITNGVVTKYLKLPGVGLVAERTGSQTLWLHVDHQGSVKAMSDASGAVVQRRTYWVYGAKRADETEQVESRGYIGERQDDETGLAYLHARYYDPELGLFISPDPSSPLEPRVGLNRYAYSLGDPTNWIDPSGLKPPKMDPKDMVQWPGHAPIVPPDDEPDPYDFGFKDGVDVEEKVRPIPVPQPELMFEPRVFHDNGDTGRDQFARGAVPDYVLRPRRQEPININKTAPPASPAAEEKSAAEPPPKTIHEFIVDVLGKPTTDRNKYVEAMLIASYSPVGRTLGALNRYVRNVGFFAGFAATDFFDDTPYDLGHHDNPYGEQMTEARREVQRRQAARRR